MKNILESKKIENLKLFHLKIINDYSEYRNLDFSNKIISSSNLSAKFIAIAFRRKFIF